MRKITGGIRDEVDRQNRDGRHGRRIGNGRGNGTHGIWRGLWTPSGSAATFVWFVSADGPATCRPILTRPMQRSLEPEILDSLPPTHPDALHNRRDLRLTNRIMRNHAWLLRTVPQLLRPGERALEIGAGDGTLAFGFARRGVPVDGLDLWPEPAGWPGDRTWHRADLRTFAGWDRYAVVFGNLIFHQFSNEDLHALGRQLAPVRAIVACEPERRRLSQRMFATFAPLLGANHVSLHDAHVSIAAGFIGGELPVALGLGADQWDVACETTWLGAYRMVAQRRK
jgi:hypothetical protein